MEAINSLYTTSQTIYRALIDKGDVSEASEAQRILVNYFILCCASSFEEKTKTVLRSFFAHKTNKDTLATNFVAKKAIDREFHKNFDWKSGNANSFFALFGEEFKKEMEKTSKDDQNFKMAISDFIALGIERNKLIHGNLVAASSGWTLDETHAKARSAVNFIETLHDRLFTCGAQPANDETRE